VHWKALDIERETRQLPFRKIFYLELENADSLKVYEISDAQQFQANLYRCIDMTSDECLA
jgi:hypothetical protein